MTILLVISVLLCLAVLFGAIATLLIVPADLIALASRPDDPPLSRILVPPAEHLPQAEHHAPTHEPTERRAA